MKSLGANALYNVIYKCLNVIFPLVTAAYVSRVLLPVGVGKVAAAQNIVSYFIIIAALGLPIYGIKKTAECNGNKADLSRIFSELFTINAISTFICSVLYLLLIFSFDYFQFKIAISFAVGIHLFANVINIDWFYQGLEEYKYIMFRSLFVKFIALVSIFYCVKTKQDYIVYALISTLSLVANYLFNFYNLRKFISISIQGLNFRRHLRPVFTLLAATIAIEIYTLADTTMLNFMKGDEIVGYYSNSVKVTGLIRMLITSICAVFLPRMNYYRSNGKEEKFQILAKQGLKIIISIAVPATVGLWLIADNCVNIMFGSSFNPSILTTRILSVSITTIAISNFIGYQILVTIGKEKIILISAIIGALINIVLNIFLIKYLSQNGAAIASVLTEGCIALYQFIIVQNFIKLNCSLTFLSRILIPILSMTCIVLLIKYCISDLITETLAAVCFGGITYMTIAYLMGNEFSVMCCNKLLKIN